MSCQASKLPVQSCNDKCPRPETMADTLPESKPWEIAVGTGGIIILVILFLSSKKQTDNEKTTTGNNRIL